jgi:hypothetical protein
VGGMERIQLDVACHTPRTADARNQGQRLQIDFRFDERPGERVYGRADAASRAPDVRHAIAAQEGLDRVDDVIIQNAWNQTFGHRLASTITLRMSLGL